MSSAQITWEDFEKLDIRTGTIIEASEFPKARIPAYKLRIDFGEQIGVKASSAQITEVYKLDELIDKQVLAVINFPPKQIANFISECLVLGIKQPGKGVVLITSDEATPNGIKLS